MILCWLTFCFSALASAGTQRPGWHEARCHTLKLHQVTAFVSCPPSSAIQRSVNLSQIILHSSSSLSSFMLDTMSHLSPNKLKRQHLSFECETLTCQVKGGSEKSAITSDSQQLQRQQKSCVAEYSSTELFHLQSSFYFLPIIADSACGAHSHNVLFFTNNLC